MSESCTQHAAPTVVVSGPAGCGKTTMSAALREAFGCRDVVDGWCLDRPICAGALHLTNQRVEAADVPGVVLVQMPGMPVAAGGAA